MRLLSCSTAAGAVIESGRSLAQTRGVSFSSWFNRFSSREGRSVPNGSQPALTARLLRSRFRMNGKTSHEPRPDFPREVGPLVEPFQDGDVRVGVLVVAVDPGIGEPGHDLVVTGKGEVVAVGHAELPALTLP